MPTSPHSRGPAAPGFTLIELVVTLFIVAVVVALLLPNVRRARPAALRTQCKNNLKQIGLALHNYHDAYDEFPPAYTVDAEGKPLHSWRTLILPYLDQAPLYNSINLTMAWDDPANAEAFKTPISTYACPSSTVPPGQTSYLAVLTVDSCLQPWKSKSISEITDGTSNTVIVIEVPAEQAVPWMQPRDADAAVLAQFTSKSKESHTGGRHALFADGTIRFLSQNIAPATFQALITARGGEQVGEF